MNKVNLALAICWTLILIGDIISCAAGGAPTWTSVFCPLVVVVFDYWIKWLEERHK